MLFSIYLNNFTSGSVTKTEEPYFSISFVIESLPSALFIFNLDNPFLTSLQVNGRQGHVMWSYPIRKKLFHHQNCVHRHLVYIMIQNN